jgi:hypothetical protein
LIVIKTVVRFSKAPCVRSQAAASRLTPVNAENAGGAHCASEYWRLIMTIRRLERSDWTVFCIRASRGYLGKQVDIEVASLDIGAQIEAHGLPLAGMSYDPKSDVLELLVGEHEHLIQAPREFYVDEEPLGIVSLQIVDADGVRQIVTLREPLMLPGPYLSE